MYQVLLEGRFLFDFVHEDDLTPAILAKYKALILANTAVLSDQQCQQLRDYVSGGGSLLATFETGFYDGNGKARPDSGLADLFGFHKKAPIVGPDDGNAIHVNVERDHPILDSFTQDYLVATVGVRCSLTSHFSSDPHGSANLPWVPAGVGVPPIAQTDQPAVVGGTRDEPSRVLCWGY